MQGNVPRPHPGACTSTMVSSSSIVGKRQSQCPAKHGQPGPHPLNGTMNVEYADPSRSSGVLDSVYASLTQCRQPLPPTFFSHCRLVWLSVTVPSPLSTKRVAKHWLTSKRQSAAHRSVPPAKPRVTHVSPFRLVASHSSPSSIAPFPQTPQIARPSLRQRLITSLLHDRAKSPRSRLRVVQAAMTPAQAFWHCFPFDSAPAGTTRSTTSPMTTTRRAMQPSFEPRGCS